MPAHEKWMDEFTGNARIRSPHKGYSFNKSFRESYHAPSMADEIDRTAEIALVERHHREIDLMERQSEALDYPN